MQNRFSENRIKRHLKTAEINTAVFKTLPSTNLYLVENHETTPYNLVVAEKQTKGRGRRGKSFSSPKGTGIYMSLLLKGETKDLTIAAAVSVVRAIEKTIGVKTGIKWVNDIYLGDKKVAGILAERHKSENGEPFVVLGIGVNLYRPKGGFDEEIKNIAGYILPRRKKGIKEKLIAEIVNELFITIENKNLIKEYKGSLVHLGKKIYVNGAPAVSIDVLENGNLLIINQNGEEEILSSGEISIKL